MSMDLSALSILVVDDLPFSRKMVLGLLADFGAKHLLEAEHGKDALRIMHETVDQEIVIISDINMPIMHGLEFLKCIRSGEGGIDRDTPFAMLTGHSDKHLVEMALDLDVNAFLIKPVSKKGLEERLNKMLRYGNIGQWLKSVTDYKSVHVESALDNINMAQSDQENSRQYFSVALKTKQPLFRSEEPVKVKLNASTHGSSAKSSQSKSGIIPGWQCSIKRIPEKAVVARDIHTSDGRFLIAAGQNLTPRVTSILNDLYYLNKMQENVWIAI